MNCMVSVEASSPSRRHTISRLIIVHCILTNSRSWTCIINIIWISNNTAEVLFAIVWSSVTVLYIAKSVYIIHVWFRTSVITRPTDNVHRSFPRYVWSSISSKTSSSSLEIFIKCNVESPSDVFHHRNHVLCISKFNDISNNVKLFICNVKLIMQYCVC